MIIQKGLVPLIILLMASGCSSDPEARRETLGAVTTMSAFGTAAIFMPLIPFTGGYNAISESKERNSDKLLYEKLDPVYEKRIEMIKARSPEADAMTAWDQGARAYLSSRPNVGYYPGLDPKLYRSGLIEGNQEQISRSQFLTYLQTLTDDDPLQAQAHSFDQTFRNFLFIGSDYQKLFNRAMYQKIQATKAAAD